ncbi:hypothetical protein RvY_00287 [Ramazzottius varieornatus]|uniref:NIF3-like protein 1 n=1 Tax=Ramazzottius varieornatus TaxID=947166 RepID=A0A1D1UD85_RAMVA|nr:hypothetical protein RvY_00287 [Ramazzottius varieornatus]
MTSPPIYLHDVAEFLRHELSVERFTKAEQGGIHRRSMRSIRRIGLALEPFPGIGDWVRQEQLDVLWLHRHWQLDMKSLPADVGLICHHLPFDEALTIGYNAHLAKALKDAAPLEPLGYKEDDRDKSLPPRPIGMIFDVEQLDYSAYLTFITAMFKGYERLDAGKSTTISRLAVVGAMTDVLVRQAAQRGAQLYLTGAYRKAGELAVKETGIAVIAVGHLRCEVWGLYALAKMLEERWPTIECVVREPTS